MPRRHVAARLQVQVELEQFAARFVATAPNHDLLASANWGTVSLRPLIETALEPYLSEDKANVLLDGPEIRMTANGATTLGMILHELVTNASKYGALSVAGGRVEISWGPVTLKPADEPVVQLKWVENGGPPVETASPAGFGTNFITRSAEYEMTGKADLELAPDGVRCTITFPASGNIDQMG